MDTRSRRRLQTSITPQSVRTSIKKHPDKPYTKNNSLLPITHTTKRRLLSLYKNRAHLTSQVIHQSRRRINISPRRTLKRLLQLFTHRNPVERHCILQLILLANLLRHLKRYKVQSNRILPTTNPLTAVSVRLLLIEHSQRSPTNISQRQLKRISHSLPNFHRFNHNQA